MPSFNELGLIGKLGGTLFNPERHELMEEGDWLMGFKRRMAENGYLALVPRMFLYHHKMEDTIVLAFWRVSKEDHQGFQVMQELWAMKCLPGEEKSSLIRWLGQREETPTFEMIEPMLRPARAVIDGCRKVLREEDERLKREKELEDTARGESSRFLKQKTGSGIPDSIPFVPEKHDDYSDAMKGKVIYG